MNNEHRNQPSGLPPIKKAAFLAAFFVVPKPYAGRTFSACQPLGPLVTSNWTV
jgi:hypothetical protein